MSSELLEEEYRKFRKKYKPDNVKVLFVLESPPKPKKEGPLPYFYNEKSQGTGRSLWKYFDEALFQGETREKEEFLRRFKGKGFYLIDVFPTRKDLDDMRKEMDYSKAAKLSQNLFSRILKIEPRKVVLLGKRNAKFIAGCLPFGSQANVDRFQEFMGASF